MKIIYWHNVEQPFLKFVAIECAAGYFKCEMPYLETVGKGEYECQELRTMTHSISQAAFDQSIANGSWIITKEVTYEVSAK